MSCSEQHTDVFQSLARLAVEATGVLARPDGCKAGEASDCCAWPSHKLPPQGIEPELSREAAGAPVALATSHSRRLIHGRARHTDVEPSSFAYR